MPSFSKATSPIYPISSASLETSVPPLLPGGDWKVSEISLWNGDEFSQFSFTDSPVEWINGKEGVDTVIFNGLSSEWTVVKSTQSTVSAALDLVNTDWQKQALGVVMEDVERVVFKDKAIAFDVGVEVVSTLRAVLGESRQQDIGAASFVINEIDSGRGDDLLLRLVDTGALASLAGGGSNEVLLNYLFHNLTGRDASSSEIADLMPMFEKAPNVQLAMLETAKSVATSMIDVVGIQTNGLVYSGHAFGIAP